jgi:alkanesulfonate monooxygenase SsuD/methylene tetrahydromethanopterin reductase-like flavin-dependent oxidoreductase (luciferase family)
MTHGSGGRPLKIGVQLPEVEYVARWPELRDMARAAEDVGLDSVWVGDHLLYREDDGSARGPWEAWTLLSALAAVTSRVELGPLVASTSFHNPAMLAKIAATVDEISGGRLILGLGAGWNEVEYRAYGFPFDARVSRFEEAFTIIRTLLREGFIDFEGRFYTVRDCELLPRGPRTGGPPLMVGSIGPRMLRITLPHVDAWNTWYSWYGNRAAGIPPLMDQVDQGSRDVGRAPEAVTRTAALLVRMPGGGGRTEGDRRDRSAKPLLGTPEVLAEELRSLAAAGVHHVQLVLDPIDRSSIEALAPALALLDGGQAVSGRTGN